jgi:serine/threonine protein kinase
MSAEGEGRRRTQAWMGEPVSDEPVVPVVPVAPVRASRWVPAAALPAYPQAPAPSSPSGPSSPSVDPAAAVSRQAGQLVGGRYRLLRALAHGVETEAWSAEHVELGRPVVIKFVHADSSGVSERLLQQARVLAKIRHPHIAEFTDFGRTERGEPYFVMEQLDGRTLQQMLDQRGGLPWARAVAIVQQVGEALAAGHAQGVVHGDLRPANVFLIDTGQPGDFIKVVDFGLASDPDPRRISAASAGFASPEQASASLLDPRSDVYALGCLLYALIVNDPPFVGPAEQVLWAQIHSSPKLLRERAPKQFIPEELQGIVTRCLEKLPARRFTDTRELAAALAQFARLAATAEPASASNQAAEPQASRSQVMGFAGRPAPKDVDELDRSLRSAPVTRSVPVVQVKPTSTLAILGIVLGVVLAVGGAGIGVYMLVQSLLTDDEPTEVAPADDVAPREPTSEATPVPPSAPQSEQRVADPVPAPLPSPPPTPANSIVEGDAAEPPVLGGGEAKTRTRKREAASEPASESASEPKPEPAKPEPVKPTTKPDSKANDHINHDDLVDPWG